MCVCFFCFFWFFCCLGEFVVDFKGSYNIVLIPTYKHCMDTVHRNMDSFSISLFKKKKNFNFYKEVDFEVL